MITASIMKELKQEKINFKPKNVLNVFSVYELDAWPRDLNADFTCLFGAVKLTKNPDPDKYSYSGIGFDSSSLFSPRKCFLG